MEIQIDQTEHRPSELSWRLLAEAGQVLTTSIDPTHLLVKIAQLLVPRLADTCIVHLGEKGPSIRPLAVTHRDPQQLTLTEDLQRRYPPDPNAPRGVAYVLRTGQSEFYPQVTDEVLGAHARDAEHFELTRALGLRSLMIVPLLTPDRTLGTLTLALAESGRRYVEADRALAEEIARRAALTVDQAQQHTRARQRNAELEALVMQRTAQLQASNTELEKSRTLLLRLADHEQAAREEERTRLARELHDELGQDLTALKMDLAWLRRHTQPQQTDLLQKFQDMAEQVDTTIRSMRRIVTDLRPALLDDLGFLAALEWQLQEFEKHTAIHCRLTSSLEVVALDAADTSTLFRIFQETLTNVARHAAATQVSVVLEQAEGYIRLEVQDNGRGFSESQVDGTQSFGLLGMQERVKARSGDFYIQALPGQGTRVVAQLPVHQT